MMSNTSDEVLVKESINGNYDSFAKLVDRYSNMVYAVALSKTRDSHHSEDIAQEVFVKAWQSLSKLDEGEKFSIWLISITKNKCIDYFRKNARKLEKPMLQDLLAPIETFQKSRLTDILWETLDSLDDKYRIVLVMNYITGYSAKEIAYLLNISQSAIESRLRRGKEKLKKELLEVMADTSFGKKRVDKEFTEEVMWRIVPRIATIEIPVSDVNKSVIWYNKILGIQAVHQDEKAAMMQLQGGSRIGVPTIYLVQTDEKVHLTFKNSNTGVLHSVIDFYIQDLERFHLFLKQEGVKVTDLNFFPGSNFGGFGFEDPDGNLLSATNVTHSGQA
jgi:RNA polymerase sigma factor (sigma-70 family)